MKKKWLIKLSSILGCFGLCGAFALSSMLDHKQNTEDVNAAEVVNILQYTDNISISFDKTLTDENNNDYVVHWVFEGTMYYLNTNQNNSVQYEIRYEFPVVKCKRDSDVDYISFGRTSSMRPWVTATIYLDSPIISTALELLNVNDDLQQRQLVYFEYNVYANNQLQNHDNLVMSYTGSTRLTWFVGEIDEYLYDGNLSAIMTDYQDGYNQGYQGGYQDGYNTGYGDGYYWGSDSGYQQGYEYGKEEQLAEDTLLFDDYYQQGYTAGYQAGSNEDATVTSIFGGIATVAMVPVNFFLSIFNFEILGVNIAAVVSALLSICIIIIVWRTVMGGKGND